MVRPREPGRGDPEEGQPAAEEDGLAAVAREERLAALEERLPPLLEPARAREQAARAVPAELVADVVADDRRERPRRAITSGSESLSCEARIAPVISAVSPGSGIPADSPPMSSASRR